MVVVVEEVVGMNRWGSVDGGKWLSVEDQPANRTSPGDSSAVESLSSYLSFLVDLSLLILNQLHFLLAYFLLKQPRELIEFFE